MNDSQDKVITPEPLNEADSSQTSGKIKRQPERLDEFSNQSQPKTYHIAKNIHDKRKGILNGKVKGIQGRSKKKRRVKINKNINQSLADAMEKMRLYEYAEYLQHPFRLLFMNFLIGIARGLGATIGLALVLVIAIQIAQNIISANLPLISEWVLELIELIGDYYRW